ncbi:PREDICTED: uncharacterized protein LOC109591875 [Amphimedon queenslandica]|uniref:Metallo-beta-lactamase domain-containing protein n=1 Tax=Amphimedon queenslandica TaxID=400682 RepID=A0AAN0K0M3_AMPQE|nr:PREDICTED: uncharacterized protein LOC109591875 [Amphimedon queenslandica]|eukprot:XP_019863042.1 PREDICTED: uncharacterized protein LOC109591875 [Amphimedon queenslandica]
MMKAGCIILLVVGAAVSIPPPDDQLHIYALPVGQGDSTVVQCPKADNGMISIIDMGSSKSTGFSKDDALRYLSGQEIKLIMLTHSDADHINFIQPLLDTYQKDSVPVYHSCQWSRYRISSDKAVPHRVSKCCGIEGCNTELVLCPNSNAVLLVVGSELSNCGRKRNRDSILAIIKYQGVKTLVVGDFEGTKTFIRKYLDCVGHAPNSELQSDIYRLSHHGAWNGLANRREFLAAVDAKYVFSSSGLKSNYKHPRCELYDIYKGRVAVEEKYHEYTCYKKYGGAITYYINDAIYATN